MTLDIKIKNLYAQNITGGTISMLAPPAGGYENAERKLYWDEDLNTLSIGVDENLILHAGQDQYYYIKAQESISKGDVIYASGVVGGSSKIVGAKYIADNTIEELYVLGLAAQDISVGEFGYVSEFGRMRNFVTTGQNGENWSEGDILYASPTVYGGLTNVRPIAPYQDIPVAIITNEAKNGSIFIRPTRGFHLDELHDVHYPSNPTSNDLLSWTSNNRWEPVASSDVSVGNSAKINTTNDTSTTTLYPVMVGAAGDEQTPKVTTTTTALKFDASTRELTVGSLEVLGLNKSINIGDGNTIDSSSEYTLSVGKENQISGSTRSFSYGKNNTISNSQNSISIGENNSSTNLNFINQLGNNIDGEADYDWSGWSVSMNSAGDRVAIGARLNDGSGSDRGHTRIYQWNGSSWTQLGNNIDGEADYDWSGYSVSINAAGNRVAIGAIYNDGNGFGSGHTRIYEWNGSSWTQLGQDIDGEAANDWSGYSVSMNSTGDRVAIGAILNDGNGTQSGHVRIYEWNGSSWVKLGQDIDGEAAGDRSGYSVSMNSTGNRVAIGAIFNDGNQSGHTRIYEWNESSWTQLGSDIDSEATYDQSGYSVSMNSAGNRVAIGAILNDGNGTSSGHTRVYEYNTNTTSWTQLGQDIDGEAANDLSGYSVSINSDGNRVAIGAIGNDGNGDLSGHTRIYEWNGSSWTRLGSDIDGEAAYDQSGWSVSMNAAGNRVAIGAIYNDANGTNSGHVRIYQIENNGSNIAIGNNNTITGLGSTAIGYLNQISSKYSAAIGRQISLNTEGVHELGYWSTPSTRGSAVRVHGKDGYVAISLKNSSIAYTDGGATIGSEADGSLMREAYALRRDGTALYVDFNAGGTISTKRIINGSGTTNAVPLWTDSETLGDSILSQDTNPANAGLVTNGNRIKANGTVGIKDSLLINYTDGTYPRPFPLVGGDFFATEPTGRVGVINGDGQAEWAFSAVSVAGSSGNYSNRSGLLHSDSNAYRLVLANATEENVRLNSDGNSFIKGRLAVGHDGSPAEALDVQGSIKASYRVLAEQIVPYGTNTSLIVNEARFFNNGNLSINYLGTDIGAKLHLRSADPLTNESIIAITRGGEGTDFPSGITQTSSGHYTFLLRDGSNNSRIRFIANDLSAGDSLIDSRRIVLCGNAYSQNGAISIDGRKWSSGSQNALMIFKKSGTQNDSALEFRVGSNIRGSISYSDTGTSYNVTSDYRLKENVVEITDGIERLKQLKPSRFNFISNTEKVVDGFIAHEVESVIPEAVTGEKDATEEYEVTPAEYDDYGNLVSEAVMGTRDAYQQIDQAKIVPLLTAALQEAIAKIESLEARIQSLENN